MQEKGKANLEKEFLKNWNTKDQEVLLELNNKYIDKCATFETRKKGKGIIPFNVSMLLFRGVDKDRRGTEGVGSLVIKLSEQSILKYRFVSGRIVGLS